MLFTTWSWVIRPHSPFSESNLVHLSFHFYLKLLAIVNYIKENQEFYKQYIEEVKPYAATRLKYYGDLGTLCGAVEDKQRYDEFVDFCKWMDDIEYASTSRFVDGEIVEEIIVDNGPETDSSGFTKENR